MISDLVTGFLGLLVLVGGFLLFMAGERKIYQDWVSGGRIGIPPTTFWRE